MSSGFIKSDQVTDCREIYNFLIVLGALPLTVKNEWMAIFEHGNRMNKNIVLLMIVSSFG